MYSFEFDAEGRFWHVRCEGFWSIEEAGRYCDEVNATSRQSRASTGRARYLIDISQHGVQSAKVMDCLDRVPRAVLRSPADRIAIVQTPGLGKMQIKRRIKSQQTRIFESEADARKWLAEAALVDGLALDRPYDAARRAIA